jgi:membrane associated rhomboid family serine protease
MVPGRPVGRRPRRRRAERLSRPSLGATLAVAWLAAVGVIAALQAATGSPRAAALASTPDGIAHGQAWTLLTSGLVIDGAPLAQFAGTALVVAGALRALGGGRFWLVALTGHVGATLVTYAGVALLSLTAPGDVDRVIDAPDYGVSAVWAACLGAVVAKGSLRRAGAVGVVSPAFGVAGLAVFVALVPQTTGVAAVEHLLAFALGGLVELIAERKRSSCLSHVASPG